MSLANKITIARGLLIPPILVLFFLDQRLAAFLLFGIACAGDILDGMVARSRGEVTTWGKVLDPTFDKALYVALICSLYVRGELSLLALVLFLVPQVAIGLGAIALHAKARVVQGARIPGKVAAVLTFGGVAFLIMGWPGGREIFYASLAVSYLAAADYARSALATSGTSS